MENPTMQTDQKPLEIKIVSIGLILTGLSIAITGASYILNMTFAYQWLVWIIGLAFIIVGILTIVWPRGFRSPGEAPEGRFRQILIGSMPLAFIVSSQVCGLGLMACTTSCHIINIALIILALATAVRLYRDQSISAILIIMIVVALIPHCVCLAPINTLWHSMLGGVAPTCEMIPMAATLYAIMAVRGVNVRYSAILIAVLFVVMVFIIVGGLLFGFPWQGCVDHPGMSPSH